MKYTTDDFIRALKNAKWEDYWADDSELHDASFDHETREQILAYRKILEELGVVLLDHEIISIWSWVSTEKDMNWRICDNENIQCDIARIEEFVTFWLNKNDGHCWIGTNK